MMCCFHFIPELTNRPWPNAAQIDLERPTHTLHQVIEGWDRFGRIVEHLWEDYGAGSTDVVKIGHRYDRASNRLYSEDVEAASQQKLSFRLEHVLPGRSGRRLSWAHRDENEK